MCLLEGNWHLIQENRGSIEGKGEAEDMIGEHGER